MCHTKPNYCMYTPINSVCVVTSRKITPLRESSTTPEMLTVVTYQYIIGQAKLRYSSSSFLSEPETGKTAVVTAAQST